MNENWKLPVRIEKQYAWAMEHLVSKVFDDIDFSGDYAAEIQNYVATKEFRYTAHTLASKFIEAIYRQHNTWWWHFAKRKAESREIYQLLRSEMHGPVGDLIRQKVDYNATLISSAPLDISKMLAQRIQKYQLEGMRANAMLDKLQQLAPGLTRQRLNLIARTEASKASTALTQAQSVELGLEWYVWKTSEDGRVRSSHRHMNDVLVKWTDPPSPESLVGEQSYGKYNAGEIFNCRCYPEPVIDMKYLTFPHKVFVNGHIRRMGRNAFEQVA